MNPPPNSAELLATERRLSRPAGYAALVGALLFVASVFIQSSVGGDNLDTDAGLLTQYGEDGSTLLLGRVIYGLGLLCFTLPLYTLFRAIQARSDRVRNHFVAFCFIGPVLLAIQGPVQASGFKDAGEQFVGQSASVELRVQAGETDAEVTTTPTDADGGSAATTAGADEGGGDGDDPEEQRAEDLVEDSGTISFARALLLPALLGMVTALVYISLWAMRTGLMTRFWGTLGMALGVALIILPFAQLGVILWFLALAVLLLDRWPGGRPPAWDAGVAIPWVKPGDSPPDDEGGPVEGRGRDVSGERAPDDPRALDAPAGEDEPETDGNGNGPSPRKRKRRG